MSLLALGFEHEREEHQPGEDEDEGRCQTACEADDVGDDGNEESEEERDEEPYHALDSQPDALREAFSLLAVVHRRGSVGAGHRGPLEQEGGVRGGVGQGGAAWGHRLGDLESTPTPSPQLHQNTVQSTPESTTKKE